MADETIVEYVTLQAKGIAEVEKQLERLERQTTKSTNSYLALAKAQLDPKFQAAAAAQNRAKLAADSLIKANQELIRQTERRLQLQSRLGNGLGAAAYRGERAMNSGAGKLASRAGLGVIGMAVAGFSGTVEAHRLGNELSLISRELAGALKPAIDGLTWGLRKVRGVLEGIGPAGQNVILAFAGVAAAQQLYARTLGATAAIQAGSTALGGAGAAAGGAAAAGGTAAAAGRGGLRAVGSAAAKWAGPVGLALGFNDAFLGLGGEETWYSRSRRAGHYRALAPFSAIGQAGVSTLSLGLADDRINAGLASGAARRGVDFTAPAPTGSDRRSVMKMDSGTDAIGGGYERFAVAAAGLEQTEHARLIQALEANTAALQASNPNGSNMAGQLRGRN